MNGAYSRRCIAFHAGLSWEGLSTYQNICNKQNSSWRSMPVAAGSTLLLHRFFSFYYYHLVLTVIVLTRLHRWWSDSPQPFPGWLSRGWGNFTSSDACNKKPKCSDARCKERAQQLALAPTNILGVGDTSRDVDGNNHSALSKLERSRASITSITAEVKLLGNTATLSYTSPERS